MSLDAGVIRACDEGNAGACAAIYHIAPETHRTVDVAHYDEVVRANGGARSTRTTDFTNGVKSGTGIAEVTSNCQSSFSITCAIGCKIAANDGVEIAIIADQISASEAQFRHIEESRGRAGFFIVAACNLCAGSKCGRTIRIHIIHHRILRTLAASKLHRRAIIRRTSHGRRAIFHEVLSGRRPRCQDRNNYRIAAIAGLGELRVDLAV